MFNNTYCNSKNSMSKNPNQPNSMLSKNTLSIVFCELFFLLSCIKLKQHIEECILQITYLTHDEQNTCLFKNIIMNVTTTDTCPRCFPFLRLRKSHRVKLMLICDQESKHWLTFHAQLFFFNESFLLQIQIYIYIYKQMKIPLLQLHSRKSPIAAIWKTDVPTCPHIHRRSD